MLSAKRHLRLCTSGKNDSTCTTKARQRSLNSVSSKKCSWNQNSSPSFATRITLTKAGPKHNNTNNQIAFASKGTPFAFHLFIQCSQLSSFPAEATPFKASSMNGIKFVLRISFSTHAFWCASSACCRLVWISCSSAEDLVVEGFWSSFSHSSRWSLQTAWRENLRKPFWYFSILFLMHYKAVVVQGTCPESWLAGKCNKALCCSPSISKTCPLSLWCGT